MLLSNYLTFNPTTKENNTTDINHTEMTNSLEKQQRNSTSMIPMSMNEERPSLNSTVSTGSITAEGKKDVPLGLTVNGTTPSGKPRLYVCTTCTRAFARQEHLNRHERSHTHEKPFVCGVCERLFSRRDLLLRHAQKLHLGCADAITRIRKKSSRRKSSTISTSSLVNLSNDSRRNSSITSTSSGYTKVKLESTSLDEPMDDDDEDDDELREPTENKESFLRRASSAISRSGGGGVQDNGKFPYINLTMEANYPDLPANIMTNPTSMNQQRGAAARSGSIPVHNFDSGVVRNVKTEDLLKRRASFSALSSANYSMPIPNTSYLENVEFATPSLNPTTESNWLNGIDLDAIPELSLFNTDTLKTSQQQQQQQQQGPQSPFGTSNKDTNARVSTTDNGANVLPDASQNLPNISGYSFYENDAEEDFPVVESLFNNHHLFKTPNVFSKMRARDNFSPIDEESPDNNDRKHSTSSSMSISLNVDRNLNEIEEITDLNIPKMYDIPLGYSFYGNIDQQSSSNSASSNATISPSLLDSSAHNNVSTPPQRVVIQTANTFTSMLKLEKYSRIMLFSPILRSHINHTLNNYPFVGVKVPNLPSNDKLNVYTQVFINRFLPHYPFVHKSMLNEYLLMKTTLADVTESMTSQVELDNLRASVSCLPLLVATLGALLNNEKQDASSLYEVSRRCIHVYLDSRKKKSNNNSSTSAGLNNNNASPLWLIQSLTLSVIYGLFADNEVSINVVIRQVNALTALVKSSEMTKIRWDYHSISNGTRVLNEDYFYDFIKYESLVRTIHSIFHVVTTLTSLYNILPSLKLDDLDLDLPNSNIYWNASNVGEFKSYYNGFAVRPENYKKCLNKLISMEVTSKNSDLQKIGGFFFNHHVSDFGLVCLQNGLHQLFYYNKLYGGSSNVTRQNSVLSIHSMNNANGANAKKDPLNGNYLNICKIWNLMIKQCKLYTNESKLILDSKLMNYHLLLKNAAFNCQFDFNLRLHKLKEQVWLKDYNKMCDIFKGDTMFNPSLSSKRKSDDQISIMIFYCLLIIKEFFFPDAIQEDESVLSSSESIETFFVNYDSHLAKQVSEFLSIIGSSSDDLNYDKSLKSFAHINKVCSLQFQILFDVFLILIKYILNFDKANQDLEGNLHSSFSFPNSPTGANSADLMDVDDADGKNNDTNDLFKPYGTSMYLSVIKMFLSLQTVLEKEFQFNGTNSNSDGNAGNHPSESSNDIKQSLANLLLLNDGIDHGVGNDKEERIFTGYLGSIKNSDNGHLVDEKHREREFFLLSALPRERVLNDFFRIIDFIFDFVILDKLKFKFGCFKNLNCALVKLNFFIFNDGLIGANGANNNEDVSLRKEQFDPNLFNILH